MAGNEPVIAVAFDQETQNIAAAYGSTVEIFGLPSNSASEDDDVKRIWKRLAVISADFSVFSLAWNCKGMILISDSLQVFSF